MTLKDLMDRVNVGEVVPAESINGMNPLEFFTHYEQPCNGLVIQDDYEKARVYWIFNENIRAKLEYNPCK